MSKTPAESLKQIAGKVVFVSGGAGFIGSSLIGRLVPYNKVIAFDNLERNALEHRPFASHPNLQLVIGDVLSSDQVRLAMPQDTRYVVHCASLAGVKTVRQRPVQTMRVNMVGSANMLETVASLRQCDRMLCLSTSEVYGQHADRHAEDAAPTLGPAGELRWTYGASKLALEHLALAYHLERGLPATILRPFNIYGPGQVGEGALSAFVRSALRDHPLEIDGDGSQIRAWCYVDDMIDAILQALVCPEAAGQTFNIGNPRTAVSMAELATIVKTTLNSSSDIVHRPERESEVKIRIPAVDKARAVLSFEAKTGLIEGILATAEYYRAGAGAVVRADHRSDAAPDEAPPEAVA